MVIAAPSNTPMSGNAIAAKIDVDRVPCSSGAACLGVLIAERCACKDRRRERRCARSRLGQPGGDRDLNSSRRFRDGRSGVGHLHGIRNVDQLYSELEKTAKKRSERRGITLTSLPLYPVAVLSGSRLPSVGDR